jgi:hypothetical protein
MGRSLLLVALLLAGVCSPPVSLTAAVDAVATHSAKLGGTVELVLKVTNTGPAISDLGFVFRTQDRWYERHEVTDLGDCSIASDAAALACGDLAAGESKTYAFRGVANAVGAFHFELALRELVHPFDYVNDHPNGADTHVWDETVSS